VKRVLLIPTTTRVEKKMKICRYVMRDGSSLDSASPHYGLIEGETVIEISGPPWAAWSRGARSSRLAEVRLLAPVEPSKVVCIGRNYAAHAAEMGNEVPKEPLMFLKPPSSIVGPEETIVLTRYSQRVEHEGELALVMGRRCSHLGDGDDALSFVMGYTCLNDVTARDLQKSDVQFTRAKGFDTFCAVGPHIETALDPRNVMVETHVNGARRQSDDLSGCVSGALDFAHDDLDARRRDRHRYARGRRAARCGGYRRG
jgi:2-keto-4-pentenoate hydratase/2-oxohepta-3-ene-1,7-dioic acid hydratase in catechol pathway